jgi:hypothetical protein
MSKKNQHSAIRWVLISLGWLLLLSAPVVGALPGPGFLIVFPVGLALILKNSLWAKRLYARHTKRHPEYGRWMDWALRRTKATHMPVLPNFKRDLLHMFRRDDIDQKLD